MQRLVRLQQSELVVTVWTTTLERLCDDKLWTVLDKGINSYCLTYRKFRRTFYRYILSAELYEFGARHLANVADTQAKHLPVGASNN